MPWGAHICIFYETKEDLLDTGVTYFEAGFPELVGRLGRVSFNPLKHIDPFGTILMPALLLLLRSPFLFGYAKSVPVNFNLATLRAISDRIGDQGDRDPPSKWWTPLISS
jgi:Zn-dependent protease